MSRDIRLSFLRHVKTTNRQVQCGISKEYSAETETADQAPLTEVLEDVRHSRYSKYLLFAFLCVFMVSPFLCFLAQFLNE